MHCVAYRALCLCFAVLCCVVVRSVLCCAVMCCALICLWNTEIVGNEFLWALTTTLASMGIQISYCFLIGIVIELDKAMRRPMRDSMRHSFRDSFLLLINHNWFATVLYTVLHIVCQQCQHCQHWQQSQHSQQCRQWQQFSLLGFQLPVLCLWLPLTVLTISHCSPPSLPFSHTSPSQHWLPIITAIVTKVQNWQNYWCVSPDIQQNWYQSELNCNQNNKCKHKDTN